MAEEIKYAGEIAINALVKNIKSIKEELESKLDSGSESSTNIYIASAEPSSPEGNMLWIYDEDAYNFNSNQVIISGEEPTDTTSNPTWIEEA